MYQQNSITLFLGITYQWLHEKEFLPEQNSPAPTKRKQPQLQF